MKTEVIMKRNLFGSTISQKSKSEFFSATDLIKAGNRWRRENDLPEFSMKNWLHTKSTKEFIKQLELKYGKAILKARGRGHHTWVHPFLFIDLALAINPKLKVEVYDWLYDHLLKYRNNSGDSYKKMCGALYENMSNKSEFPNYIKKVAEKIVDVCNAKNWQETDQNQLELRDKIHDNIALLSDVLQDNDQAVQLGIKKTLDDYQKKLEKRNN